MMSFQLILPRRALLLLLLGCFYKCLDAQDCGMDIWVFDSLESCRSQMAPVGVGKVYADGTCRTIETDVANPSATYDLFPGNYRAVCTDQNQIRLAETGCISDTCASGSSTTSICARDLTLPASLYSRLDPPEYLVEDVVNTQPGGNYRCLRLLGTSISVTFAVFGDCSVPGCSINGVINGGPTSPVAAPVASPVAAPTPRPTGVPTSTPTGVPTSTPTATPTQIPTPLPTFLPTGVPSFSPSSMPSDDPTFAPIVPGSPTREPTTEEPTSIPSSWPSTSPALTPTAATQKIATTISVGLRLSPLSEQLQPGEDPTKGLELWEAATVAQITQSAERSVASISVMLISNIVQELKTGTGDDRRLKSRYLVEEDALEIYFDLAIIYYVLLSEANPPLLKDLFERSFDTEQDRINYLLKLVVDPVLSEVRTIEVLIDGAVPDGSKDELPSGGGGIGIAVIIGAVIGVLALCCLGGFFVYRSRKDQGSKGSGGMFSRTKSESPSTLDKDDFDSTPAQQRWTNEITLDVNADDVSTLGGSVLQGLNLVEGGVQDEPTASVIDDFDFTKNKYRTGASVADTYADTRTGAATMDTSLFSKIGMNGEAVFDDDMSFEKQFEDENDETDDEGEKAKPFRVRAPPGMLGMVLETPDGTGPVVRAIKPDSVLASSVRVGDRLLSVDRQDVSAMSAKDVSTLISQKLHQERFFVFLRLPPPS